MLMKIVDVLSHDYMGFVYLVAFLALLGWCARRQNKAGARPTAYTDDSSGTAIEPVTMMDSPRDEPYKSPLNEDRINPATGLTAYGGSSFDSGGNLYGTSSSDDLHR